MYVLKIFKNSKLKAFTLAEVLAAISLFAVMTVGIASVLGQTNSLIERLKSRQNSVSSAQVSIERLQRDLQAAFDEKIQRSPSFFKAEQGTSSPTLSFTYLESPIHKLFNSRSTGLRIVSYYLEKDENESFSFFRKDIPYYEKENLELIEGEKIANGVLSWEMEYYDPRNDQWVKEWDDKGQYTGGYFPTAVRLKLRAVDPNLDAESRKARALTYQTSFILLNEITEGR